MGNRKRGFNPDYGEKLRVLIVDEEIPFPPNSGKRLRSFNLVKELAQRHEIVWISRRLEGVHCCEKDFQSFGIRTIVLDDPVRKKSGARFYLSLLVNMLSPYPYVVASHLSKQLRNSISQLCARESFDLVHCEWTPYAVNLPAALPCPTHCMAHNVESVVWRRNQLVEQNPLKRFYFGLQAQKMERFERGILPGFSRISSVSKEDKEIISQWVARDRIAVVPNGVDVEYFQPMKAKENPGSLIFIGSLDWRPNIDCMLYFLDQIWPRIKRMSPEVKITIVGRNPNPGLMSRAERDPAVTVNGSVEDVRPFLDSAEVCVVPLRVGSGSRLKILEAFAMEKPVVSTSIGAEGLDVEHGKHLLIADSPDNFAAAVVKLLREPAYRGKLSLEGRRLVEEKYSWKMLAAQLELEWQTAVSRRDGR
jgi:polysaccharide biosynthesis protein PslH